MFLLSPLEVSICHNTATLTWGTFSVIFLTIFLGLRPQSVFQQPEYCPVSTLNGRWQLFVSGQRLTFSPVSTTPTSSLSLCSPPPGQILGGLWVSHKILFLLWAHHQWRALWLPPCKGQVYRARCHLTVDYFHHHGIVPEYAFLSLTTPLPSPRKTLTPKLNFRVPVSGEAKSFIRCLPQSASSSHHLGGFTRPSA